MNDEKEIRDSLPNSIIKNESKYYLQYEKTNRGTFEIFYLKFDCEVSLYFTQSATKATAIHNMLNRLLENNHLEEWETYEVLNIDGGWDTKYFNQ